jgi:hypothetical protein
VQLTEQPPTVFADATLECLKRRADELAGRTAGSDEQREFGGDHGGGDVLIDRSELGIFL